MKFKSLVFLILFAAFGGRAFGQGGFVPPQIALQRVNDITRPISEPTITVCAANVGGSPCSPPLVNALFKDAALTQPLSNPFPADANGTYPFAIVRGPYTVMARGFAGDSYQVQLPSSCVPAGSCAPIGKNNALIGTNTFSRINNVVTVDGITYACSDVGIKAAMNALDIGSGGTVDARGCQGAMTWASNMFLGFSRPIRLWLGAVTVSVTATQTPSSNVYVQGCGVDCTALNWGTIIAAQDLFTVAVGSLNFEISDLTVDGRFVTRTGGCFVNANGSSNGYVHNVRMKDPYGGICITPAGGQPASGWRVDHVQFWGSSGVLHNSAMLRVGGGDGSGAADTAVNEFREYGGYASQVDDAQIVLDSGTDTFQCIRCDVAYSSVIGATSVPVVKIQNTLALQNPRWVNFFGLAVESGLLGGLSTADCVSITGGDSVNIYGFYASGCGGHAMTISGGSNIEIIGGVAGRNGTGGIYVTGGKDLTISAVNFGANSVTTTNTTDDIQVASGVNGLHIVGNHFNKDTGAFGVAQVSRYGINLLASSTTTNVTIEGNDVGTPLGTAFMSNNLSGASVRTIQNGIDNNQPMWQFASDTLSGRRPIQIVNTSGHTWSLGEQFAVDRFSFRDLNTLSSFGFSGTTVFAANFNHSNTADRSYSMPDTSGIIPITTNPLISNTAPTIAAGDCGGTAASIAVSNGTAAFKINVGTTPGSACTITMPAAATGWNCSVTDITTNSTSVFLQKQTGAESATSVTLTNFSDVAVATAFVAGDILKIGCYAD
jgi:hypothetical protein